MDDMRTFRFREGVLDIITPAMRPIDVLDDAGSLIGRIVRGQIDGCERSGTFRFEPDEGATVTLGVRTATARSILGRLVRPSYVVAHEEQRWELQDLPGENLLYFAIGGDVDGHRLRIREDWDGSVEVMARTTAGGRGEERRRPERLARFEVGEVLLRTTVRIDWSILGADGDPRGSALFGTVLLLPFLHRIYTEESGLMDELLFG